MLSSEESRYVLYINSPIIVNCIITGSLPYIMFMCVIKGFFLYCFLLTYLTPFLLPEIIKNRGKSAELQIHLGLFPCFSYIFKKWRVMGLICVDIPTNSRSLRPYSKTWGHRLTCPVSLPRVLFCHLSLYYLLTPRTIYLWTKTWSDH